MNIDDRTALLDVAFRDWTRLRSTYFGASWRAKLNNFEMSEVDVIVAHMDRVLSDFMAMGREHGAMHLPSVMPEKPDHLNGHGTMEMLSNGPMTRGAFSGLTAGVN